MEKMLAFRLDDIAPGLNRDNFKRLEKIFDDFGIKPLIGIVPQNEDPHLVVDELDDEFWDDMRRLKDKGWMIALHGFRHIYSNECKGLLNANPFSEFAGVEYEEQFNMIERGKKILESHGLTPEFFMAPGHTFDENTLKALLANGILRITDGYSLKPYVREEITFYPCRLSGVAVPEGYDTVCIHLNNWVDIDFEDLQTFISKNKEICIGFDSLLEIPAADYDISIKKQETRFYRNKIRRDRIANDTRWQNYLSRSYSKSKPVKIIKRLLYLPTLKPEVTKVVVFLLIALFLLRSLSYIMRTNGESKDRFAGFYAKRRDTIDVLMIGSSTVGTSFSAPYMWGRYGFTSYPLSTNSLRPKAIKYLIEEGLKYQSPELIVIEMRTFIADDDDMAADEGHIRETVDNMRYSLNRIRAINALTEEFDDKLPFYFDIMKYHPNWGILLEPNEWKKYDYSVYSKDKGFSVLAHTEGYRDSTPQVYTEDRIPIPRDQEQVLKELISYLKENQLQTLFVVSPRAQTEDYEEMMNYAGDIVREAGYDFIDLNYMYDRMGFDYRHDFDDGAHTNIWGAVKCSDALGEYIKDNYSVTYDHDKRVIKQWDDAYDHFIDIYNTTVEEEK